MLKLLIFDLDGTLADTSKDIADAINYAVEPVGQRKYTVEETKAMVGSGISKLLESLVPPDHALIKGGINAKELVTGRFFEYYSNHLLDNTRAYPGIRETLPKLTGFIKAVLSNKREAWSREILERLGMAQYLDIIWGSDSVREKKPSPVPIMDLLKEFNVAKEEAVIIGDSNFDVEAGRAAGIKVIAVTYGFRGIESLKGADFIIDGFDELLNVLPQI